MSQHQLIYNWQYVNKGLNPIKAFGAMRVVDWDEDADRGILLHVKEPDGGDDPTALNSGVEVAPSKFGMCSFPTASWGRLEGDYPHNSTVGQADTKEYLSDTGSGFSTIGTRDATTLRTIVYRPNPFGAALVHGKATTAVTGGTITIDNIILKLGTDPRTDPESTTETLSVENPFSFDLDIGGLVQAIQDKDGNFWADQAACPA